MPSFKLLRMLELNHHDALSSLFSMSTDAKRGKCITNERSSIYGLLVVYRTLFSRCDSFTVYRIAFRLRGLWAIELEIDAQIRCSHVGRIARDRADSIFNTRCKL